MRGRVTAVAAAALLTAASWTAALEMAAEEFIADIRVHGNVTVPDAEVLRLSGLTVGGEITAGALVEAERRLRESGRFDEIEVRKRYRSLDMREVAIVVIVHEPPGPAGGSPPARLLRRALTQSMFLPILSYDEGYGFTYGARVSTVDWLHSGERISVPLTWGGTKRAAAEVEWTPARGPVTRVATTASAWTRVNPHYELDDHRLEGRVRVERSFAKLVRLGADLARADVTFGTLTEQYWSYGADVTLDTRRDPQFPGNAVLLSAGWLRLDRHRANPPIDRRSGEARGFVRLMGTSILAVRVRYDGASGPLPAYERLLIGGASTVRGHAVGELAGDRRLVTSAELRVPVTSPLHAGRSGFRVFIDAGAASDAGGRLRDASFARGAGAGVFLSAPFVSINLDAARNLNAHIWRAHFGLGFRF